ncbi:MAG: 50S ribosomal protein L25 [Myxococcales bacterium]|nr:MAG: 50S ribosomal protein L25 [Myxococcales bacterium]
MIELQIDGKAQLSMVRDLQIDPVRRDLIHADFYRIYEDQPIKTTVPFRITGRAAGVVMGGELHVVFHELPIRALPGVIPTKIEVDVTPMELHDIFHVSDLKLPEGVEVTLPAAQTLVHVQAERNRGEAADAAGAETPEAAKDGGEAASAKAEA